VHKSTCHRALLNPTVFPKEKDCVASYLIWQGSIGSYTSFSSKLASFDSGPKYALICSKGQVEGRSEQGYR